MRKIIVKKGFGKDPKTNHDFYFHHFSDGRASGKFTFFSRGTSERELSVNRQNDIAKQMGLQLPEFREFMECSLTLEGYNEILSRKEKNSS